MNSLIETDTNQESQLIGEVMHGIDNVNQLTQKTANTVLIAAASGNEFSIMANQLEDMIKNYLVQTNTPIAAGKSNDDVGVDLF